MKSHHIHIFSTLFVCLYMLIFLKPSLSAHDTITQTQSLTDGKTLVSSGQTFELGFFSPSKTNKFRYLGIWYKTAPETVLWVANRNNPLSDSFGELAISENKNQLFLLNGSKSIIWSSNLSLSSRLGAAKIPVAQILDNGNFILRESESTSSESYLWQSFDYPTDTLLTGMKLGWDLTTSFERRLASWKSADDPSNGNFTCRIDIKGLPNVIVENGSKRTSRVGPWNGVELSGYTVRYMPIYKQPSVFNENEAYVMPKPRDNSAPIKVTLNNAGEVTLALFQNDRNQWFDMYSIPYDQCDNYGYCGANGICRVDGEPICHCLEGFVPSSKMEWEIMKWSRGCVRRTPLDCQKGDGFVELSGVKLPDLLEYWLNKNIGLEECKETCLKNCSCVAYANSNVSGRGSGCLIWFHELVDVRELRVKSTNHVVYVRLSASEIRSIGDANKKKKRLKIKLVASISSAMSIFIVLLCCTTWKLKRRARGKSEDIDIELPLFDLPTVKNATENFSAEKIIGKGGFGPVYKGVLPTGQKVAVKRLSKSSGQGPQEFKTEVELIAKLQHKNLVALLGCCVEGDERILIYEYMPNKSLDHFIFDDTRRDSLSWEKKFDIAIGVARGLLYLHQDSKLQIIHRDLKAANILLDGDMNPKISDFGLARIFRGDENENRTKTIVGTYGYISPEYAIDGKFSVKSDVFSFGVLLLEIVSKKRNRKFSHPDHHHNLLGHAWLLWSKGRAIELIDPHVRVSSSAESQLLRCVHVGLLCVQKYSKDRPTMNSVLLMLANEGANNLPGPKEPGFFAERSCNNSCEISASRDEEKPSLNGVTITFEAR